MTGFKSHQSQSFEAALTLIASNWSI